MRNLRRDPRACLCVLNDGFFGSWIHVEGMATIVSLPGAMEPFVDYYRAVWGEHLVRVGSGACHRARTLATSARTCSLRASTRPVSMWESTSAESRRRRMRRSMSAWKAVSSGRSPSSTIGNSMGR